MIFQKTVELFVNRLNSEESVIPYEYNHFDFCLPNDEEKSPVENLGQVVFGERIRPSPYKVDFMKNVSCEVVCTKEYDNSKNHLLSVLRKGISLNYHHHWIMDNMPVTYCYQTDESKQYCQTGFQMGCYTKKNRANCIDQVNTEDGQEKYYIYNHVDLRVTYHSGVDEDWGSSFRENGGRIISVKVVPRSIDHEE